MKKKQIKKEKKPLTYVEAHNKAFWAFHKSSRILIWAGILNVAGLLISLIQTTDASILPVYFIEPSYLASRLVHTSYNFSLGFSTGSFIFRLLEGVDMHIAGFIALVIVIAVIFSTISIVFGVFASQGKKWALFTGFGLYLADMAMIVACYALGEPSVYLWIMIGIHVVILAFLSVAVFQYYNLHTIEKVYNKE